MRSLLLSLLLTTPLAAQRPDWSSLVRDFDRYAVSDSVVGGSVVLVQDGRIVRHHEYGWADRDRGQRTDERTIYHWGSITKTLTAVTVMQLRDRGLLSLDDPVTRWIPELRQIHDPYGAVDSITVAMLLSHSSGFQNPTWPWTQGKPWEPFEPTTWNQLVAMMPYEEVHFKPGTRFSYSNPGFIYLARIVEDLTGDPFETYLQKNVWTPLGLTHSYFGATPYWLAADRSNNYTVTRDSAGHVAVVTNGRDFNPGITRPNGAWNAPVSDLAAWMGFLIGHPGTDTALARRYDVILSRKTLAEMWRPRYEATGPGMPPQWMGLSFFLLPRGADTLVGHTGEQAGFRSFFFFNPKTGRGVIGVVNTRNDADPKASSDGYDRVVEEGVEVGGGR
jgi:CubicO group peptidase (beta-lactamase class C family)